MKKPLTILFLAAFVIPSVAFASWWNPFTWKIFQKRETEQQLPVLDKKAELTNDSNTEIKKLQAQIDDLKKQTVNNSVKQTQVPSPLVNNLTESKNDIVPLTSRLLTEEERVQIKQNANSVISKRDKLISDIQGIKDNHKNSNYLTEYLELFNACDTAKDYFEEDKDITMLILKAVDNKSITNEQMEDVYKQWSSIIKESNENITLIYAGLANLNKLSNELVTAIIEKEAIEEVAIRNNIPLNYSGKTAEDYSRERIELEKKANDYIKSLIPKEKERKNNFILLINRVYVY
jgi:hypothetical protein